MDNGATTGPTIRSTARAVARPYSSPGGPPPPAGASLPVQPADLQDLQRRPEFVWPDTAFKEDDLSYKDNIRIYDLSDRCCRRLRLYLTGSSVFHLWCVKDIAGIIAAGFTWGLVIFGELALFFGVLIHFHDPYYSALNGMLNMFMAFLGLVAHSRCMFMDPVSISSLCTDCSCFVLVRVSPAVEICQHSLNARSSIANTTCAQVASKCNETAQLLQLLCIKAAGLQQRWCRHVRLSLHVHIDDSFVCASAGCGAAWQRDAREHRQPAAARGSGRLQVSEVRLHQTRPRAPLQVSQQQQTSWSFSQYHAPVGAAWVRSRRF